MTALLDVNVLVSLAWPNHVHHAVAHAWFAARSDQSWATTPFTEAGFVRVSSGPGIATRVTPQDALRMLALLCALPTHTFLIDDVPLIVGQGVQALSLATHRDVTDGHLVAVAHRHGAQLATFDRGLIGLAADPRQIIVIAGQ